MSHETTTFFLAVLILLSAVPLLGACNTVAGAGEDISQGGRAIERSADRHAP